MIDGWHIPLLGKGKRFVHERLYRVRIVAKTVVQNSLRKHLDFAAIWKHCRDLLAQLRRQDTVFDGFICTPLNVQIHESLPRIFD